MSRVLVLLLLALALAPLGCSKSGPATGATHNTGASPPNTKPSEPAHQPG